MVNYYQDRRYFGEIIYSRVTAFLQYTSRFTQSIKPLRTAYFYSVLQFYKDIPCRVVTYGK